MKICETCKTEVSDSTRFCTQCGTELTKKAETVPKQTIQVHKCPYCNLKYQKNTFFCSQCGAVLVDVEEGAENGATTALMPSVSGTNNPGNTKEKTGKKEWKFMGHGITYWIAAVIFAIFMLYFKKTNW